MIMAEWHILMTECYMLMDVMQERIAGLSDAALFDVREAIS